ncbi:MAG: fructose-bisphosphate aldolase [candidate division Zixibacteria bacterium SM23_73]|nr:MAG: fructose-bisphosphate aldolase [candidate division Zixibacteria bacterium SM23_73]
MDTKILDLRPKHVLKNLGSKSRVCLLNSHDIFKVLMDEKVIIMACNARIKHVIPGIMRAAEELDSVVAFELAKSEGSVNGGYTGQTPQVFFETVVEYAEESKFSKPFFIHGDHTTVKDASQKALQSAKEQIEAELKAGYTSIAIDASFNELEDNIRITSQLATLLLPYDLGLEVEVGEVKRTGEEATLTTVEEATAFIDGLEENGIHPDLLAINNGSKHGNYLAGEKIFIDLERTGEIFGAIKPKGICIAQHGITGTPLNVVGQFADYGIRKGNVGTEWQNIAHQFMPQDLMDQMKRWAQGNKKDIKFATRQFKRDMDSIPEKHVEQIEQKAYETACSFINAFRAKNLASLVKEKVLN